jgi:hypothetical protein
VRISRRFYLITCMIVLTTLTILVPVLPVSAAATVYLSPITGPPGTIVAITGGGFTAGNYTVNFGSVVVIQSTAVPGDGTISRTFIVPTLPRTGTPYGVTVTTTAGDTVNVPTFTITPAIWLSASSGLVADEIHVSGYGFLASTTITISFDSTSMITTSSDSSGTFSNVDLTIPSTTAGWHTVSARDYIGASPGVVFVVSPTITLSASTGTIGSSITCSGNGFATSSIVSFSLDSTVISGTATTNSNGAFGTTTLTVPAISGGVHTFQARDASGNSATASITINASLAINPNNGPSGTTVTVTGSGFQANGTISITYNGVIMTTSLSPVTANSSGGFIATFTASALPAGIYSVVVSDATRTASAQFTSIATATMTPASGSVGTSIIASGTGFKAKSAVYANFDGAQVALGASDINGNFTITFTVSSSSTGTHQITITDKTNTLNFSFSIIPSLMINPTSGFVGTEITISGSGFASKHTITFKYDTEQLSSSSTDKDGAFTVILKAPVSKGGNRLITVSDDTSTLTATFAMDATAPPAPQLLFPQPLTKANKLATLDWQDVTDPSGVSYTLQIATDNTFSILILQKPGLTTSAYTISEAESLQSVSKKTPYYWRVKAIDTASNESEWSMSSTFFVGFVMSDWVQYVIFGVVSVLFGVTGYLLAMLRYRPKPPKPSAKIKASE